MLSWSQIPWHQLIVSVVTITLWTALHHFLFISSILIVFFYTKERFRPHAWLDGGGDESLPDSTPETPIQALWGQSKRTSFTRMSADFSTWCCQENPQILLIQRDSLKMKLIWTSKCVLYPVLDQKNTQLRKSRNLLTFLLPVEASGNPGNLQRVNWATLDTDSATDKMNPNCSNTVGERCNHGKQETWHRTNEWPLGYNLKPLNANYYPSLKSGYIFKVKTVNKVK